VLAADRGVLAFNNWDPCGLYCWEINERCAGPSECAELSTYHLQCQGLCFEPELVHSFSCFAYQEGAEDFFCEAECECIPPPES
jgi:hypothetical protein